MPRKQYKKKTGSIDKPEAIVIPTHNKYDLLDKTNLAAKLQDRAIDGLKRRFNCYEESGNDLSSATREEYNKRLDREIIIITENKVAAFMMKVADICAWTKERGITIGPGRGLICASLVSYCLEITDVDPIRHNLLLDLWHWDLANDSLWIPIDVCRHRWPEITKYLKQEGHAEKTPGRGKIFSRKVISFLTRAAALVKARNPGFDLNTIPLDDQTSFSMLKAGEVEGLYFLRELQTDMEPGSDFMNNECEWQFADHPFKDIIKSAQPKNFHELISLISLYRYGPVEKGMLDAYIANQTKGTRPYSNKLSPILARTRGVLVFQEQVLEAAMLLGGYSGLEAGQFQYDFKMSKPQVCSDHAEKFIAHMIANGEGEEESRRTFYFIARYNSYTFTESYSVAAGLLTYRCAYLKANYPMEFVEALMDCPF